MVNTALEKKVALEELVCKLPNVLNTNVVLRDDGNPSEIHALATTERNVKQLVRDIQSAIQARFGIEIDYKIISVAQIDESQYRDTRLIIDEISLKNTGNTIEASVILLHEDTKYDGHAIKIRSNGNKTRGLADATIAAVEKYLQLSNLIFLEGIEKTIVAGRTVYVAVVGFCNPNSEEILTGCSVVEEDENEAIVRSVLAAVNRRISLIN